jgi:hypothetical protein
MTSDSYLEAARPLLYAAAWVVMLTIAAFGWAAIESQNAERAKAGAHHAQAVLSK